MPRFLKRLFCRHRRTQFVRNVYGDEINHCGGRRSLWCCEDCGRYMYRKDLHAL
jgi:hypothetical protein